MNLFLGKIPGIMMTISFAFKSGALESAKVTIIHNIQYKTNRIVVL